MKWLVEFEGVDLDGPMSRCGFRAIDYAGKAGHGGAMSFISFGHYREGDV